MIRARSITKSFGTNQVLREVDIDVPSGTVTVLLGPNGSGKSTLLRCLSLLDPPDRGVVTLGEEEFSFPLRNGTAPAPWPVVTVVFQQLFLWPHLTVQENIELPLRRRAGGAEEFIELLDLDPLRTRYPNEISLGQRQRVALARALALRPKYLLLDEITSALDVDYIRKVGEHLRSLAAEGVGVLIITHFLGFAREIADQVAFLDDGRIVEHDGRGILDAPQTARFRRFLALVE